MKKFSDLNTENCFAVIYVLLVTSIKNSCHKWLNIQVDEHNKTDFQCFKTNRVEELFNLVEEEFATDQGDALTLLLQCLQTWPERTNLRVPACSLMDCPNHTMTLNLSRSKKRRMPMRRQKRSEIVHCLDNNYFYKLIICIIIARIMKYNVSCRQFKALKYFF